MFNHRHLKDSFLTFSTCMVIPVIPGNPRVATDNLSNIPALDTSSPVQALSISKLYHQPVKNHLQQVGTMCPIFTSQQSQVGILCPIFRSQLLQMDTMCLMFRSQLSPGYTVPNLQKPTVTNG